MYINLINQAIICLYWHNLIQKSIFCLSCKLFYIFEVNQNEQAPSSSQLCVKQRIRPHLMLTLQIHVESRAFKKHKSLFLSLPNSYFIRIIIKLSSFLFSTSEIPSYYITASEWGGGALEESFNVGFSQWIVNIQGESEMGSKQTLPVTEDQSVFHFKQMIRNNGLSDPRLYYQFLDLLGEGCYSEVYRARSKSNGQLRAIKKMRKSHDPRISCHLINQFEILRQMDHPNIVKMFEMFDDGNHHYIVTEYLEGKDALDLLQRRKVVPQELAFNIFYQVTLAINYLHRNSFMHRDIKLENIIYNQQNNSLKLIDFGSALKFAQTAPRERRCTGTIHYIAPEVINKFYNNKCDVWSLGILLYVLLSGNAPFLGKEHQTIISNILNQPLAFNNPIWKTRSKDSIALVTNMLQKNFQKRVSISDILSDPWICRFRLSNVIYKPQNELIVSSLQNMVKFTKARLNQIQLGVLVFMINVIIKLPNEVGLMKVFNRIDYKEDGEIDEGEIKTGLVSFLEMPTKRAELLAKELMAKIDLDSSGFINFTEFVVAASNLHQVLTPQNIELTFDFIDTDHSGGLSLAEFKARLGNNIDDKYFMKVIRHFNRNGDQFTKKQFQRMMCEILVSY